MGKKENKEFRKKEIGKREQSTVSLAAESSCKIYTENCPLGLTPRGLLLIDKNNTNKMVG